MKTIQATLHTDGGSRGNPGPAGIGYVLKIEGGETHERGAYIGETTNNQAEYLALQRGLELAGEKKVNSITCYLDSELVVKQLRGEYRVRHQDLLPVYTAVKKVAATFNRISFNHVRREKNAQADALVNTALDKQLKKSPNS